MGSPVFVARVRVTNDGGTWDSLSPGTTQPVISFEASLTLASEPNTAAIEVYNVSPDNIARIQGVRTRRIEWTPEERAQLLAAGASADPFETTSDALGLASIELSWGFADSTDLSSQAIEAALGVGFVGQVVDGPRVVKRGNHRVLVMGCQDGGLTTGAGELLAEAGGNVVGFEGRSYGPGTALADIVRDLANAIGHSADRDQIAAQIELGLAARGLPGADATLLGSYNASGPAALQLDRITKAIGLRWSVQLGEFLVLAPGQPLPGLEPLELSSSRSNLLGEPQISGDDRRAQTQATTLAIPGREVSIETPSLVAAYIIDRAVTKGDTRTGGITSLELSTLGTVSALLGL